MNMREQSSLLEKNISLRKEQKDLNEKIDSLTFEMRSAMSNMTNALKELKDHHPTYRENGEKKEVAELSSRPFIPTVNIDGMTMNVSTIEKRKKETNLSVAAQKLAKFQKQP